MLSIDGETCMHEWWAWEAGDNDELRRYYLQKKLLHMNAKLLFFEYIFSENFIWFYFSTNPSKVARRFWKFLKF